MKSIVLTIAFLLAFAGGADAQESMPAGCWPLIVLSVKDGDTLDGLIGSSDPMVWLRAGIRIQGIDTPEKPRFERSKSLYPAQCEAEAERGRAASNYLKRRLKPFLFSPDKVRACNVGSLKFAGRRGADIQFRTSAGWRDVAEMMIDVGLAVPYDGGNRDRVWCDCLEKGICPAGYKGR